MNIFSLNRIKLSQVLSPFFLGFTLTCLIAIPSYGAEQVVFKYKFADLSVQVNDLENFAKNGKISKELEPLMAQLSPEEKKAFRAMLVQPQKVNSARLIRFLKTSIGQKLLTNIGTLINTVDGENGKQAFLTAIETASKAPQGMTLLNLIRQFPGNLEFDIERILTTGRLVSELIKGTNDIVQSISQMAATESQNSAAIDFAKKPDLRKIGSYSFTKEQWKLYDKKRQRELLVDIYKPLQFRSGKTPVIIASHGLASNPEHFLQRAQFLASYGYFVIVPQHPGSDYNYAKRLLQGKEKEVFDLKEFINRPYDITFVLDELEKRNKSEFQNRLNMSSVGIMGHSFGGYTALASGGAEIDFSNLAKECNHLFAFVNLSELLQCEALKLPQQNYQLKDRRIKAIFAANPVNSSIFGAKGLSKVTIPTMIAAGSYDPAAPVVFEQFRSFPWIRSTDKYLGLMEGQAHLNPSEVDGQISSFLKSGQHFTLPSPDLILNYANAVTLAFFEVHLVQNKNYQPYLQSAYAEYLSQNQKFKLFLITNESVDTVKKEVEKVRKVFLPYFSDSTKSDSTK